MYEEKLFEREGMEQLLCKVSNTEKCKKCNRFVPYPCHDAEGFYSEGPWDWSCDMWFNPHRYE